MNQTVNKRLRRNTVYRLNRLKAKLKKAELVFNDSDVVDYLINLHEQRGVKINE